MKLGLSINSCLQRVWRLLLFILSFAYGVQAQDSEDLISLNLFSEAKSVKVGDSIWLGIEVEVEEGWHVYWKTSGDTGLPTEIDWTLPEGVQVQPTLYPVPYFYEYQGSPSYAYKESFILVSRLTLDSEVGVADGNISLMADFSALVCNESNCLPYNKELRISLPVGAKTELVPLASKKISSSSIHRPVTPPLSSKISGLARGNSIGLEFQAPTLKELEPADFSFFAQGDFFDHSFRPSFERTDKGDLLATLRKSETAEGIVGKIEGVLSHPGLERAWSVGLQVEQVSFGEMSETLKVSELDVSGNVASQSFTSLWLMLSLVLVALAVWIYGKSLLCRSAKKRLTLRFLGFFVFISAVWLGYPAVEPEKDELGWEQWSPERQQELLNQGKAIYVDFTARWCLSCQVNKRVYQNEELIEAFKEVEVVPLYADWTDKGPVILDALQSFGREGVPLNVYYPPMNEDLESPSPVLLPEILSPGILQEVIETGEAYWAPEGQGFWGIVGFAFLGGMILNLMPCVFPVLGLKVMAFVKQAGEDRTKITKHGLVFTVGVLVSFWLLVSVLLFLRDKLEQDLGWGFQLQEPVFVFVLAVFLLAFAMSLSGVFEIGLSMTGVGSKLSQGDGFGGSFFSGVLATVVATPCMAPFLGVAVGAALSMEILPAFTVFTGVALGLAFPYLFLSLFPAWVSRLPKPGAWMDTFKQAMAFPLYATVAWLVWTLQGLL